MPISRNLGFITLGCHAALCLTAGCQRDGTIEMIDTEGRAFTVTCKQSGGCNIAAQRPSGAVPTMRGDGRVLGVCDRDGPIISCRPLSCESDSDCPVVDGVERTCGRALCSDPSRKLTRTDVVMLCMAGTGVGYDARQRERYAAALASPESSPLPAGCRNP